MESHLIPSWLQPSYLQCLWAQPQNLQSFTLNSYLLCFFILISYHWPKVVCTGGLKTKQHTYTHTHTPLWPVALNFKDSELTATSRSPQKPTPTSAAATYPQGRTSLRAGWWARWSRRSAARPWSSSPWCSWGHRAEEGRRGEQLRQGGGPGPEACTPGSESVCPLGEATSPFWTSPHVYRMETSPEVLPTGDEWVTHTKSLSLRTDSHNCQIHPFPALFSLSRQHSVLLYPSVGMCSP